MFNGITDWLTNTASSLTGSGNKINSTGTSGPPELGYHAPPKAPYNPLGSSNLPGIATSPSNAKELQLLEMQIQALREQNASRPNLPFLNTSDVWAKAQETATAAVNPVYQDKLNNALERFRVAREQETTNTDVAKTTEDISLGQTQEDILTNRTRTGEDVATAIAASKYNEGNFQADEGTQFDAQNRADRTALADAGLTESGLGSQKLEGKVIDRNKASTRQLKEFTDERASQELFKTRTFDDLDTKGTRAVQLTTRNKEDLDRQLEFFMQNQDLAEKDTRLSNESDRLGAVFNATNNAYDTAIQQWLAGLAQSGARSQDIALAAQVYK